MDNENQIPIDRTAALVVSKGVRYVSRKKITATHSENKLDIWHELPYTMKKENDMTGRKFGKFTVIGLSKDFRGKWVVRCSCGVFSLRKSKSVKNVKNDIDCCETCRELAHLKRSDFYKTTGRDPDEPKAADHE